MAAFNNVIFWIYIKYIQYKNLIILLVREKLNADSE